MYLREKNNYYLFLEINIFTNIYYYHEAQSSNR